MNVEYSKALSFRDAIDSGENVTADLVVVDGELMWAITRPSPADELRAD